MITMTLQGLEFQQLLQRRAKCSAAAGRQHAHGLRTAPTTQRIVAKRLPRRPLERRLAAFIAKAVRPARTLVARFSCALAEHRIHWPAIEMELFRGRYKLSTKNDDDLPIVR